MQNVAVLFTNNLRLHDNAVLNAANKRGNTILPVYFHDIERSRKQEFKMRDISPYKAKCICESVNNLKDNLKRIGWDLQIIRLESIVDIITFLKENKITKIYVQEEVGQYEISQLNTLESQARAENISVYRMWDHTLVHKDDVDFHISEMPQVFTQFRKSVEKNSDICEAIPTPETLDCLEVEESKYMDLQADFWYDEVDIDSRRAIEFIWGEDRALERLQHYFWDTQSLSEYKHTRNGLIWADYSSKFSPYLASWCISPRYIYWEVKKYEKSITKNSSTYWLIFELLWRDFFQFIFLQNPTRFFKDYEKWEKDLKNEKQKRKFEKWKQGTLWVDFVDANMRELTATGFMSNRGRQIVASYLVNDLKVDWRLWAKYFESMLVDHDVASNWGNWAYVAGVWNDPRDNRYFNIEKQASNYDSDGKYRKLWLD